MTENDFLMVSMHSYDNQQCTSINEFNEDIKRFMYLKKLFQRFHDTKEINERLVINHIIILHNLFGVATLELLFYKIDKEYWTYLITFLVFLDRMPNEIPEFSIKLTEYILDETLIAKLRTINA